MFTAGERRELRDRLIAAARADDHVDAAALVGSAARDQEDQWSDIDLALRLVTDESPIDVAQQWTTRMYADHGAVAHLDIWSERTLFRVFLLSTSLQVDLSFWPSDAFAPSGGAFRLIFGQANKPVVSPTPDPAFQVGMGWLYALHARSSIARQRSLQAVHMIDGLREQVISMACTRHGLPSHQGRGVDDLPAELRRTIVEAMARGLDEPELRRAFGAAAQALLVEVNHVDSHLASRLEDPVQELVRTAAYPADDAAIGST